MKISFTFSINFGIKVIKSDNLKTIQNNAHFQKGQGFTILHCSIFYFEFSKNIRIISMWVFLFQIFCNDYSKI
jgi:hypothetical protein